MDHAATADHELDMVELEKLSLGGMNATHPLAERWGVLLMWISPTRYLRETGMGSIIKGKGLKLGRKVFTGFEGPTRSSILPGGTVSKTPLNAPRET